MYTQPISKQHSGRVPSPLLYHRRSQGVSSQPISSDDTSFTPPNPSIDKYNRRHTNVASKHINVPQQTPAFKNEEKSDASFIAARLPLMNATQSQDEYIEKTSTGSRSEALRHSADFHNPEPKSDTPPILTTTNAYIFPKRVYHVHCQPTAAWSGPSYSDLCQSRDFQKRLIFPKLIIPGQKCNLKNETTFSDTIEGKQMILHSPMPLPKRDFGWAKTSLPAPLPRLFESHCRSSTQDSFDSKFSIDNAVKNNDLPLVEYCSLRKVPPHPLSDDRNLALPLSLEQERTHDECDLRTESSTSLPDTSRDQMEKTTTTLGQTLYDELSAGTSQEACFDDSMAQPVGNTSDSSASNFKDEAIELGQEVWTLEDENEWETTASGSLSNGSEGKIDSSEDDWEWSD